MINVTLYDHEMPNVIEKTWLEHYMIEHCVYSEESGLIIAKKFCI